MAASEQQWNTFGIIKGYGIPAPSGRYSVGCVDVMHDDLLVRLMYPTSPDSVGQFQYAKWVPHPKYTRGFLDFLQMRGAAFVSFLMKTLLDPRCPAIVEAPLLPLPAAALESETSSEPGAQPSIPERFPVIVFSHGLGAIRTTYSGICCDMVSHGYVVAAVEHHDGSAALSFRRVPGPGVEEGQYDQYTEEWIEHERLSTTDYGCRHPQLLQRSREVSQALDLLQLLNDGGEVHNKMGGNFDLSVFRGRLNIDMAAVMGHSFGGGTTVQALHDDTRFKCGIGLDTWMLPVHRDVCKGGIRQPLIFINSFDFQWKKNVASMMEIVNKEQDPFKCSLFTLRGTHHTNQSDAVFVGFKFLTETSVLDKYIAHSLNQDICHAFFKRHLHKDPAYQDSVGNLDGGEGADENIIFGSNVEWMTVATDVDEEQEQHTCTDAAANGHPPGAPGKQEVESHDNAQVISNGSCDT